MSDSVGKVSLEIDLKGDLNQQVDAVAKQSGSRLGRALKGSFESAMRGVKGIKSSFTMPKQARPAANVESDAAKEQVGNLAAVLDNVNARIDVQRRKLAELKEAYHSAFDIADKNKLQEKILNTEAAILRLTATSDATAKKLWELEDSLNQAGDAAGTAGKPVSKLNQNLSGTNKALKAAKGNLNSSAKAAKNAGASMNSAGKNARSLGNEIQYAIKNTLIYGAIFKGIQAIGSFGKYLNASLKTNKQYAASLNVIRTNLAVAFQPIYEAILPAINALMSWLAKVTAYIAAFISALFGKTYKQSYNAAKGIETARKAMDNYGKSAKKTAQALASFDQLNTLDLSQNDAGAGTDPNQFTMKMPDLDISGIQSKADKLAADVKSTFNKAFSAVASGWKWTVQTFGPSFSQAWGQIHPVLDQWKVAFGKTFSDIVSLGAPLKSWLTSDVVPLWKKGIVTLGLVLAGLLDMQLQIFNGLESAAMPVLKWFVSNGLPLVTDFASGALDIYQHMFDGVKTIFDDLWSGAVNPGLQLLSKMTVDELNVIKGFWDNWGDKLVGGVSDSLDGIKKLWSDLWSSSLGPIVTNLLKTLSDLWDNHLKGLTESFASFVGKVVNLALDILNKVVIPVTDWLVQKLGPVFSTVFSGILKVVSLNISGMIDAFKMLLKGLGAVVDFLDGAFTTDWKSVWNGIKSFMAGIGDGIVTTFKSAINVIIDAFNYMIKQLNKISVDIPDWVPSYGGKSFGISIPTIPRLAKGGLVSAPTLAMVGDNAGASVDPEVVSPLSKLQGMLDGSNGAVVAALQSVIELLRVIADKDPSIKFSDVEFGRVVNRAQQAYRRYSGQGAF